MAIKARVKYEEVEPNHGVFTAEPLERGYGATLGNALRRILLCALDGAAVSGVQISALDNIEEDELEVLANIKNLALKSYAEEPLELTLEAKGEGVITARDIQHTSDIEISNPDLHIATIKRGGKLNVALTVEKGVGYQIADEENKEGKVRLSASYSPVVKVDHRVEPARVGKSLDYDRLILEVWTNGVAPPEEAVRRGSQIFKNQMDALLQKTADNLRVAYAVGGDKYSGVLTVEPLEKGYGTTLGNSLRRILLSSIEGAAVTAVKIEGVDHE
ncbi:MAG: DNA-directed RNA polymerase subunit alpha, partial [Candidatus Margulisbacteria bacterium]|nr:DNA-directed RNA polymerase subunit alpha [Candidatus Margulisiibacteriota bacterium]